MVKLVAARCPSCSASIEVNKKLENTICQYCGTMVLVEDAIEKHKIELSGNVKVKGIKDSEDILKEAKKEFKIEHYSACIDSCTEAIKKDKFFTEAHQLRLEAYYKKFEDKADDIRFALKFGEHIVVGDIRSLRKNYNEYLDSIKANDEKNELTVEQEELFKNLIEYLEEVVEVEGGAIEWRKTVESTLELMRSPYDKLDEKSATNGLKRVVSSKFTADYISSIHVYGGKLVAVYWTGDDLAELDFEVKYDSLKELNDALMSVYNECKRVQIIKENITNRCNYYLGRRWNSKFHRFRFYKLIPKLNAKINYKRFSYFEKITENEIRFQDNGVDNYTWDVVPTKPIDILELDKYVSELIDKSLYHKIKNFFDNLKKKLGLK